MTQETQFDERDMEILQALWKHGPQKPGEIQKHLSFPMKNPALRWLLNDMVERGRLSRTKDGKAFVYEAAMERSTMIENLGRRLSKLLFGGSALALIGELAESQKLSPADLEYLRDVASKRPATKAKKGAKK